MPKKYRSDVMGAVHETATDLYKVGGMDRKTMRKFDVLCLTPIQEMTPKKIRALRTREKASQTVFAAYACRSSCTLPAPSSGRAMSCI